MNNIVHQVHDDNTDSPASSPAPTQVREFSVSPQKAKTTMKAKKSVNIVVFILLAAVASGIGTGYAAYTMSGTAPQQSEETGTSGLTVGSPENEVKVGEAYGSPNEEIFKDSAEGVIQAGGLDGEGSHQLVRPGGKSQTVYLTSSVVDLKKFENAKVKVWGETFAGQKAGWLMDVGRIKVLELNAELPKEK